MAHLLLHLSPFYFTPSLVKYFLLMHFSIINLCESLHIDILFFFYFFVLLYIDHFHEYIKSWFSGEFPNKKNFVNLKKGVLYFFLLNNNPESCRHNLNLVAVYLLIA